jgi:HEAT repeat protein
MKTNKTDAILKALRDAIASHDADRVEEALGQAFTAGLSSVLVPTLIELLNLPWHTRHEDVVRALQELKPPAAVPALKRAAMVTHPYLNYDEFFGLARKCTWALADIGTLEAKTALQELSEANNPLIAGYAKKRIDNWTQEMQRKGA